MTETPVIISMHEDFEVLFKKISSKDEEWHLAFMLKKDDLNFDTGLKIRDLLRKLEDSAISFKISVPLPKCIFSANTEEKVLKHAMPKSCLECDLLYQVEDEKIISCEKLSVIGPSEYYLKDKNQIHEFFNTIRLERKLEPLCALCRHNLRGDCDGLCFRLV